MITEPAAARGHPGIGQADLVLLAREFLRDPYFAGHAAQALGRRRSNRQSNTCAPGDAYRVSTSNIATDFGGRLTSAASPATLTASGPGLHLIRLGERIRRPHVGMRQHDPFRLRHPRPANRAVTGESSDGFVSVTVIRPSRIEADPDNPVSPGAFSSGA